LQSTVIDFYIGTPAGQNYDLRSTHPLFQDVLHHRRVGIDQPETGDVRAAVFELFHVDRVKILRNIPKHVYSDHAANEKKKI